jgi:hypothetical protein
MDLPSTEMLVNLAAGIGGALIGGFCTLIGTEHAHKLTQEKEEIANKERLVTTLMLLRTEIDTAWGILKGELEAELLSKQAGTPYLDIFPIGDSPFSIFNSAPQALNQLPRNLAQDIVYFYMRAKGLIAMIQMNNQDLEQALQDARNQLNACFEQVWSQGGTISEAQQKQIFEGRLDHMAALLGMARTADAIRGLTQELEPVVARITLAVDKQIQRNQATRAN